MPGLVGFVTESHPKTSQALLAAMAHALESETRFRCEPYSHPPFNLARVTLGLVNGAPQPVWNADHTVCLLLEGEFYNEPADRRRLVGADGSADLSDDARFALKLYERCGDDFAAGLNGQFVIALLDLSASKLLLTNDRLGLHPLYYSHRPGMFLFASGVRAILADPQVSRAVDRTAMAEFLTFDHVLNQHTLLEDVALMPQASVLTVQDGQMRIHAYWVAHSLNQHPIRTEADYMAELVHHLRGAVRRQNYDHLPLGLLLSGGLDSRLLLALLAEQPNGNPIHTFTWSIPNSDDARYAREVAQIAHSQHHFFELKPDWLLHHAARSVQITDGLGNICNLHAFATLEPESEIAQVFYKGFLGDALFGFGLRPRFWADYDDENRIQTHLEAYRDYRVLSFDIPEHPKLFSADFMRRTGSSLMDDYRAAVAGSNSTQLADQRIFLDLTQRVPRMTINGVQVVRDRGIVRLPFADNELLDFALTLPPWALIDRHIYTRAFIEAFPHMARVPNTHSGLPMVECSREVIMRARKLVAWHLRNRGLGWLAGPERRPYKDYNTWFRTVLRDFMEDALLAPRTLERGYFNPGYITNLVKSHLAGANHGVRLGALIALELWHRMYIDSSPGQPLPTEHPVMQAGAA